MIIYHLFETAQSTTYQEAFGVFIQKLNDFGEVVGFPSGLILPNHLDLWNLGTFKIRKFKDKASLYSLTGKGSCYSCYENKSPVKS